jgi:two-component system, OmpR family, sensor histidine kinase CiaH
MLRYYNIIFILVLIYTISALLFWENSLQKLNVQIYNTEIENYKLTNKNISADSKEMQAIAKKRDRKHIQYLGEGGTFLIFILIGGVIVFLSFRKRLQLTQQQNNFMLSVTHELKTPLAGIKLGLETIRKRKLTEEQQSHLIENSINDTDRLNELCNNILLSTQLEGKQYSANVQEFDLAELLKSCIHDFGKRYPDKQWLVNNYIDIANFKGDSFLWKMVINNLLENAQKYASNSKKIIIDVFYVNNDIQIQILDEGKGIDDAEKKKIFHKFYRSGNENTRISKGTGLGLYIVKQAIEQHGGFIKMEDNKPNGNIAIIQIPKTL